MHPKNGRILNPLDGQPSSLQELLAHAINQTLQGVLLTDAAGTILYANEAVSLYTGFENHELLGKSPPCILPLVCI